MAMVLSQTTKVLIIGILLMIMVSSLLVIGATIGWFHKPKDEDPPDRLVASLSQGRASFITQRAGVYQELKLHLSTDIVNCDYGSGEGDIEVFTSTTAELPPLLSSSQQDTGGTNSDGYPENNQCSCTAKDISQLIANMPEMKGNQGEKGIQGIPGEKGLPGMKGDKGIPGTKGAKGDTGEHGIKGSNGLKGDRGLPGLDGKTGENGVKGDIGPAGPPGPSGPAGATVDYVIPPSEGNQQNSGIKGDKGDKGSTGSHGRGGSAGPPGSRGPPGFKGDKGWLGPPGEQGDKGDKGDSYVASLDALKFKGEKGDRGQDGLPGKEGLQGPPGPPGHYLSLSGPPGPPGPPGMTRLADEFMYPERDNCKHSRGTEETEEGMKFNTVIYKSTKSLLRNSRMIQTGTLAFVVEEESLLLRVKKGWQYIPMGSLLPLEMEDISTPRVPSPRPSHIKPLSPIDGEDAIRMVALNEPVTGDLRGFKSADFACYRDSYKAGLKGTYRAFLASRYQNIDTVVPLSAHERPVVNLRGEKLFDSWSQMFKGSGAMFQHSPRLYSFNGRNVHTHPTWPNKAVWHGATESGERAMESYCDSWHSSSPEKQGLASLISSNKLLDQNTFSCNTELILLCVDIPAHSSQKTRRKKRFTRSEEDRRLLHFRNADEYARHLVELHVTTNRTL